MRVDRRNFSNLAFHVAGAANETVYGTAHWFGGLAWTASVRPAFDRPGQRSVEVRVAGWSSYFDYPLRLCVPAAREPQPEPRRAMVVFVKANSPDGSDVPAVVAALGLHARHHACVLQLTAYEIVVREALIPSLLANPAISDLAAAGTLRFVRRTSRPNRVDGWVHSDQVCRRPSPRRRCALSRRPGRGLQPGHAALVAPGRGAVLLRHVRLRGLLRARLLDFGFSLRSPLPTFAPPARR